MNTIARYVPLHEAQKYRDEGWDVEPLPGNHGAYSALATMPEDTWQHVRDAAEKVIQRTEQTMRDTTESFTKWAQLAEPGDYFTYYTGPTPSGRLRQFKAPAEHEKCGIVTLVQRRGCAIKETHYGTLYEYDYIALKI